MATYLDSFNSLYLRPVASGGYNQWSYANYKSFTNINETIFRYDKNGNNSYVGNDLVFGPSTDLTQSWIMSTPNYNGNCKDVKIWLLMNGLCNLGGPFSSTMSILYKLNDVWSSGKLEYTRYEYTPASNSGIFDWYSFSLNQQIPSGYFNNFEIGISSHGNLGHVGFLAGNPGAVPNSAFSIESIYTEIQLSTSLPLYCKVDDNTVSSGIPMYAQNIGTQTSGLPLYESGYSSLTGGIPLSISGLIPTSSLPFYTYGYDTKVSGIPFFTSCAYGTPSGVFPMWASGTQGTYKGLPFYLHTVNDVTSSIPIYSSGSPTVYLGAPFYTQGPLPAESGLPMWEYGVGNYNFSYRNFTQYKRSLVEYLASVSRTETVGFNGYWYNAATAIKKLQAFDVHGVISNSYLQGFYTRYNNGFPLEDGIVFISKFIALSLEIDSDQYVPNPFHPDYLPFYISASYSQSSGLPIYTQAVYNYNFDYNNGVGTKPYLPLFVQVAPPTPFSGGLPFYVPVSIDGIGGVFNKASGLNFYTKGSTQSYNRGFTLFTDGGTSASLTKNIPLYTMGQFEVALHDSFTLYTSGPPNSGSPNSAIPFYLYNSVKSAQSGVPFYTANIREGVDPFSDEYFTLEDGGVPFNRGITLYITSGEGKGVPFFVKGMGGSGVGLVPFSIGGANLNNSGIPMYTKSYGNYPGNLNIYTHGF